MGIRIQKRLVIMLTMHINQQIANLFKNTHQAGFAIKPGTTATVNIYLAFQGQRIIFLVKIMRFQNIFSGWIQIGEIKGAFYCCDVCTGSYNIRTGFFP